MPPQNPNKLEQVIQKFFPDSTFLHSWDVKGGISAHMTAVEIQQPADHLLRMIIRRHGTLDLKRNPRVAADEFKLLHSLKSAGLPVPTPYHLDQSGEIFPTPYIVIEYIEGKSDYTPAQIIDMLPQFTTNLISIHKLDCSKLDLPVLPSQEQIYRNKLRTRPAHLDESMDEAHIRAVLEAVWPLPQTNSSALLHGDYWPGNILWHAGKLVAIIDWEDAAYGDPLADIAISRLDLLWKFGIDAMQQFTRLYQTLTTLDFTNLPCWDLCAALRPVSNLDTWAEDDLTAQKMRSDHRWFINQAFAKIASDSLR